MTVARNHTPPEWLTRAQPWLLLMVSVAIVIGAPEVWNYTPDSGVYVGSASTIVEQGRYWFNGHPNLLYYPGTSAVVALPVAIFGLNFHAIHLVFSLLAVTVLWLARAYFSVERFGWAGLALPFLLAANQLFQIQAQQILSDLLLLNLVLLALLAWRKYDITRNEGWFYVCAVAVAAAPMVRFQGLFLLGAFGLAVLVHIAKRRNEIDWRRVIRHLAVAALTTLPFSIWTLRNYLLHTPDTYNMANAFFFGLEGLRISGPGFGEVDWIDAEWKYPVYQIMYLFGGLGDSFLGNLSNLLPLEVRTGTVLVLMTAGLWPWLKRAGMLEIVFVALILILLVEGVTDSKSMRIVDRYWIPILPFVISIAGQGLGQIRGVLAGGRLRTLTTYGSGILMALILVVGTLSWSKRLSPEASDRIARINSVASQVAEHVDQSLPPDALIMASDWGVAPFLTKRKTIQVLRSPCDQGTLELIHERKPAALVVLPGFLRSSMADELAMRYPDAFQEVFRSGNRGHRESGAVYHIEHDQVPQALALSSCEQE